MAHMRAFMLGGGAVAGVIGGRSYSRVCIIEAHVVVIADVGRCIEEWSTEWILVDEKSIYGDCIRIYICTYTLGIQIAQCR